MTRVAILITRMDLGGAQEVALETALVMALETVLEKGLETG